MANARNRAGWFVDTVGTIFTGPTTIDGISFRYSTGFLLLTFADVNGQVYFKWMTANGFNNVFFPIRIKMQKGLVLSASSGGWGEIMLYEATNRRR